MKKLILTFLAIASIAIIFQNCSQEIAEGESYAIAVKEIAADAANDMANKIREEVNATVADGLTLDLWASDSLIHDPIAISIDEKGRIFYTSATRQTNSEFDIRGHQNWMTASISFETVEDRRAFLRKTFAEKNEEGERFLKDLNKDGTLDWKDLAVEKEQVWFVEDKSGDGVAERAQLYIEDYGEEITDVANGIEAHDGDVYIAVGPDLWRTTDNDGDGIADESESLSHGYAVHIGFSGHGMSGAKIGPDGRIWWGIGDIGMNVVDKEGKRWKYPNQGVIVRSELDGTGFEVYSAGLRNTHEFVWDQYGNLISEDNDGDHAGEKERLVHLINGSDCGWRTNWQFGKYTDPDNNSYKVWMDEKLSIPHWEGQAAYILPPITNYVNGPTGMVYNPGTALSPKWYNHFFIAEFRGSPANSPIHAFTLRPKGASFELDTTREVVKGLLPTGLDFGPDGALYFGDWIDGWGTKNAGRIWKLDDKNATNSAIRLETKALIEADFKEKTVEDLADLLKHQDMRIRQKAQFELVKRNESVTFLKAIGQKEHQLARIHGLWGLGQLARKEIDLAANFKAYLNDTDLEIVAQAIKMMGDVRYVADADQLIPHLNSSSLRVRLMATEALGRMAHQPATARIVDMLMKNNDMDIWLRHAGMIALSRIGDEAALTDLKGHRSKAVRTAAVVALRRMKSPKVAVFLQDREEYIVAEAARAINDDWNIKEALPALAKVLEETRFTNEPLLRRAINAALEVGTFEAIRQLTDFAVRTDAPAAMRAEALAALSTWTKPSVFDRVDGRYRGEEERGHEQLKKLLPKHLPALIADKEPAVQVGALEVVKRTKIGVGKTDLIGLLRLADSEEVRRKVLETLAANKSPKLAEALEIALADKHEIVRSTALEILPTSNLSETKSVQLFETVLKAGTIEEKQSAIKSLGTIKNDGAISILSDLLEKLNNKSLTAPIQLDVIEAIEAQGDEGLVAKLADYQSTKSSDDPLSPFIETLEGGNIKSGQKVFYGNAAAQCVRCHAIFEYGGNAGPGLEGVADRMTPTELLESLIAPSAKYALGYEVVNLTMKDGSSVSGIVSAETTDEVTLKIGKEDIQKIAKKDIETRTSVPSSMPPMGEAMTKREIRDLLAFLGSLKKIEQ